MTIANHKTIVLGGGCFWCLEAAYKMVKGVTSVEPGYSGGFTRNPGYEEVGAGTTGHAEVVRIIFDADEISLSQIMAIFWTIHDPTSLNRQGADIGSQYASVAFYGSEEQRRQLVESKKEAQRYLDTPIVTRIEALNNFYEAEPAHHNYYQNHPESAYCHVVIGPKLDKLRLHFTSLLQ